MALVRCTVGSVDEGQQTCNLQPLNGDAEIFDVKLKATLDGLENGMVVFPKVGSQVIVGLADGTETDAYLLLCSEFDKVVF